MRLGISTATCGQLARPPAVRAVAAAAEQVGYSSVWAVDGPVLDPLAVVAATAAVTTRLRLGAAIVVGSRRDPSLLAHSLASLDALSEGRLSVSLRPEEAEEGYRRLEATLTALVPGHPPVLVATPSPADIEIVAFRADGWDASGFPVDVVAPAWERIHDLAAGRGRDPGSLQLLVRAEICLSDVPLPDPRQPFTGSPEQVADDIEAAGRAGVDEVVLGLLGNPSLDEALDGYARVAEAATLRPAA